MRAIITPKTPTYGLAVLLTTLKNIALLTSVSISTLIKIILGSISIKITLSGQAEVDVLREITRIS